MVDEAYIELKEEEKQQKLLDRFNSSLEKKLWDFEFRLKQIDSRLDYIERILISIDSNVSSIKFKLEYPELEPFKKRGNLRKRMNQKIYVLVLPIEWREKLKKPARKKRLLCS